MNEFTGNDMKKSGLKYFSKILVTGSVFVSLSESLTKIVSFLLLPLFTYYLSPQDYGLISMIMLVSTFLGLLYNPGVVSATTRLYHDTDILTEKQEIVGSAFMYFLGVPLVFMLILTVLGSFIFSLVFSEFEFYPYGIFAVLLAFFTQPKRIWSLLLTLQYKVKTLAAYSGLAALLGISVSVILVVIFKMGVLGKVLGMFPPVFLILFLSFRTVNRYTNGVWSVKTILRILKFGYPLTLAIWSYEILNIADRYILERMTSLSVVGLYTISYQFAQIPLFLMLGMRKLWNPIFYENMNRGDYFTLKRLVGLYIAILSGISLLSILFSKEAVLLFVNERYHEGIPIIGVIVVGVYFSALLNLTNAILGYQKMFWMTSTLALIASIMNIVLNILFIPKYGLMGAAGTTVISYLMYLVGALWIVRESAKRMDMVRNIIISSTFLIITTLVVTYSFGVKVVSVEEILIKCSLLISYLFVLHYTNILKIRDYRNVFSILKK
jgi:O-antigen/teichoic acid export membrane protein